VAVVGGGIVGLATARKLVLDYPKLRFILVEKESFLAGHQTGHNSGVIHAGIYYTPGSLKAKLCVQGLVATYKYCDEHGIPYKKVGKLIVAYTPEQAGRIDGLMDRGIKNNVPGIRLLTTLKEIQEIEPNCVVNKKYN
jgi:2-hydroxyglutarate dehydrogenase